MYSQQLEYIVHGWLDAIYVFMPLYVLYPISPYNIIRLFVHKVNETEHYLGFELKNTSHSSVRRASYGMSFVGTLD